MVPSCSTVNELLLGKLPLVYVSSGDVVQTETWFLDLSVEALDDIYVKTTHC